jgi:hypothetical protein
MIFTHDGTLLCRCGNTPSSSGFDPCTATGTIDYTLLDANSPPGLHYICNRCGLIGPTE